MLRVILISRPGIKASLIYSPEGNEFTLLIDQAVSEDAEQYNDILSRAVSKIKQRGFEDPHISFEGGCCQA